MTSFVKIFPFLTLFILLESCTSKPGPDYTTEEKAIVIEPDYTGIVIPPNIAPLNFVIKEEGTDYFVRYLSGKERALEISSGDNSIQIPKGKWKKMIEENKGRIITLEIFTRNTGGSWMKFKPVEFRIALEPIDRYLVYRLIPPGYESWAGMSIEQRDLEDFRKHPIIENSIANENCVNCHSISSAANNTLMFHMRGGLGGTYFLSENKLEKFNLKAKEMKNGAVYPRWHPSGKFIAFSSNKIIQQFHSSDNKKVEVTDLESSLLLYDVEKK